MYFLPAPTVSRLSMSILPIGALDGQKVAFIHCLQPFASALSSPQRILPCPIIVVFDGLLRGGHNNQIHCCTEAQQDPELCTLVPRNPLNSRDPTILHTLHYLCTATPCCIHKLFWTTCLPSSFSSPSLLMFPTSPLHYHYLSF